MDLLSDHRPGSLYLLSVHRLFQIRSIRLGNLEKPQYSNFKWGSMMFTAGLAADILFYSPLRVDALRHRAPYRRSGGHAGLGFCVSPVPLGPHPLELLHDSGRGLRLYAPRAPEKQAEILRSLPAHSGKAHGFPAGSLTFWLCLPCWRAPPPPLPWQRLCSP